MIQRKCLGQNGSSKTNERNQEIKHANMKGTKENDRNRCKLLEEKE